MSGLVLGPKSTELIGGVQLRTFKADKTVARLPRTGRRTSVTEVVVHETVTRTVVSTVAVLQRRKLGVHLIVGPDGEVTQHGALLDVMSHAGPHNKTSVGIEVVSPYYPGYLRPGFPWMRVIDAPWAHKGEYVLPTLAQAETTARLIDWLTLGLRPELGLEIPRSWVGLAQRQRGTGGAAYQPTLALGRLDCPTPTPGIWAHHYFGHADGAWLVLYAYLRLDRGLSQEGAYARAVELATGARHVARL